MTDERNCALCAVGIEVIDGWHYTRVGGMMFPTNRRCEKLFPREPAEGDLTAVGVVDLQCSECGDPLKQVDYAVSRDDLRRIIARGTLKLEHPYSHRCKFSETLWFAPITALTLKRVA